MSTVPGLGAVNTWASQHHERFDGKGYPFRSHDLSFSSRIVAVADVLTAITDNRPWRNGRTNAQCLAVLDKLLFDGTLARMARPDPA
ncbi:HD-GYP domain-containing protein [Rhodoferax fermentans]|uniref:HD-GYP domain-containing protein n=1 Tax=Rhodoferax fermentans TaxID=28066 RepID=A0A1T1AR54_RHOFE|nr:HD domain-containing phosphohydrolase [Rhodoferax fermentans]OOV06473.1 hypothetical protein RF819_06760 [Rhodoferax fermentans]